MWIILHTNKNWQAAFLGGGFLTANRKCPALHLVTSGQEDDQEETADPDGACLDVSQPMLIIYSILGKFLSLGKKLPCSLDGMGYR